MGQLEWSCLDETIMMSVPIEIKAVAILSLALAIWLTYCLRADYSTGSGRLWRVIEDFISQWLMLMMVIVACIQILARYVLPSDISLPWTEELGRLMLVWVALWGAAVIQRNDEHICMTAVFSALGPSGQRVLLAISDLVTIVILVPITYWGWGNARMLDIITSTALGLPLSVFAYSVPVTGAIMIAYSICLLIARIRGKTVRTHEEIHDI